MNSQERIELFLKYQKENMSFEDISKKLEIKPATLRKTLNKNGYKSEKGKYIKTDKELQISFEDVKNKKSKIKDITNIDKEKIKKTRNTTPKRDKKINITQEDLDKICEVYDWYMQVRDNKALKPKKSSNKKDIDIEDKNVKNIKSVNIRVDKDIWEEFERLCSNSSFQKKEILTQAIKDFMKTYKNLL